MKCHYDYMLPLRANQNLLARTHTQNKRRTELSISNVDLIWKNTARQHRKLWIRMLNFFWIEMKPPKQNEARGKSVVFRCSLGLPSSTQCFLMLMFTDCLEMFCWTIVTQNVTMDFIGLSIQNGDEAERERTRDQIMWFYDWKRMDKIFYGFFLYYCSCVSEARLIFGLLQSSHCAVYI